MFRIKIEMSRDLLMLLITISTGFWIAFMADHVRTITYTQGIIAIVWFIINFGLFLLCQYVLDWEEKEDS